MKKNLCPTSLSPNKKRTSFSFRAFFASSLLTSVKQTTLLTRTSTCGEVQRFIQGVRKRDGIHHHRTIVVAAVAAAA